MKSDTVLYVGLIGIAAYVAYRLMKPAEETAAAVGQNLANASKGVSEGITQTSKGVGEAVYGTGSAIGTVLSETGETYKSFTDTVQTGFAGVQSFIGDVFGGVKSLFGAKQAPAKPTIYTVQGTFDKDIFDKTVSALTPGEYPELAMSIGKPATITSNNQSSSAGSASQSIFAKSNTTGKTINITSKQPGKGLLLYKGLA